ncbi:hypothetical protein SDC9_168964 [bioreactor metagenome]|uniref:Uncharacterized protein n=1 Tax=bioreactor metagenome TaxID=1076179 RepID=A0A645GC23_9ZZZZ
MVKDDTFGYAVFNNHDLLFGHAFGIHGYGNMTRMICIIVNGYLFIKNPFSHGFRHKGATIEEGLTLKGDITGKTN